MWTNKKHGKKQFKGRYVINDIKYTGKAERVFTLMTWKKDGTLGRVISFESWQAAKALGWVKVK